MLNDWMNDCWNSLCLPIFTWFSPQVNFLQKVNVSLSASYGSLYHFKYMMECLVLFSFQVIIKADSSFLQEFRSHDELFEQRSILLCLEWLLLILLYYLSVHSNSYPSTTETLNNETHSWCPAVLVSTPDYQCAQTHMHS